MISIVKQQMLHRRKASLLMGLHDELAIVIEVKHI